MPVGPLDVYCVRPDGAMMKKPLFDLLPMRQVVDSREHGRNRSARAAGKHEHDDSDRPGSHQAASGHAAARAGSIGMEESGLIRRDVIASIAAEDIRRERRVRRWRVADVCEYVSDVLELPGLASKFRAASVDGRSLLSLVPREHSRSDPSSSAVLPGLRSNLDGDGTDLETLLGIENRLHRRKLVQAIQRLQTADLIETGL